METKIFNLVILDQSGSMSSIMYEAISGFNETLQTIKSAQLKFQDQRHLVSLVVFNGDEIRTVCDCVCAAEVRELDNKTYCPDSDTPLYDAIGKSVAHLRKVVEDGDKVLVTIITDGMENASKEYSQKNVSDIIKELKNNGWVFTYIGANQDVEKVASSLSINNKLCFESSPKGTHTMFAKDSSSRMRWFSKISSADPNLQDDFFAEGDK